MISLDEIQSQWRSLLSDAEGLDLSSPFPVQEISGFSLPLGPPLLALDAHLQHHLLLPVAADAPIVADRKSTGVQLLSAEWREQQRAIPVADIVCLKPHLNDLFDLIAIDVLKGLEAESTRPDLVARRVLERWRELLSREPGQMPEKSKIIGLLGELTVLRLLSEIHRNALNSWTGPTGARHDFSGQSAALEVKSTLQRRGLTLTINSIDQLLPPQASTLHLAVMRFEEAPFDGKGIADVIGDLDRLGVDNAALLERTTNIGFPLDIIVKTADQKFRLLESRQYVVDASFPRIVPESFRTGGLPNGVIALTYEIDLSLTPPIPLSSAEIDQFMADFIEG